MENFNLAEYLTGGVENLVKNILRATLKDPKESAFMLKYSYSVKEAAKKRAELEKSGEHIPPFLIASITSSCNLHCAGCYARHNHACCDSSPVEQLSDLEWLKIFREAKELGISFILLAGGEPMIRRDVISVAGNVPEILFPIFTNGTMIDETYIDLFEKHRNLVPVFSIEGHKEKTDSRRGEGVYTKLTGGMEQMQKNHLIFGASVTVTRENLCEVFSRDFVEDLNGRGCKVVFYVEYVPVSPSTAELAPTDEERAYMERQMATLREAYPEMIFVSFPGDEKSSGGCLAAGRGFFHINSHGGAEPCPFSPYSDINVRDTSLREALRSELFLTLQSESILTGEHTGGCVLFEQKDKVEAIIERGKEDKCMGITSVDAEDDQFAYRYDTQLLIDRRDRDLDEDEIADYITENIEGNSLIAAGDEDLIKIHFHTNEPWKVLEYCNSVGEIYDVVVEDMIRQAAGLQG